MSFLVPNSLKLISAGIVIASIAAFGIHYNNLKGTVERLSNELDELRIDYSLQGSQLREVTQEKEILTNQVSAANEARAKIQSDLQVTLRKLRNQKPPLQCQEAIDWSVDNKDDLKW